MKLLKMLALGLAMGGLCATQAIAQPGLFAGVAKHKPAATATKVQFKIPFGMSARKARELLSRDGFEEIDISNVGLIDAIAEACRKGTRYKIRIRSDGSYVSRDEIGKCRPVIRADAVDDIVARQGYDQIDLDDDGTAPYDITACRRGDRYQLEVDQYGDVTVKGKRGRCESDMISPRDVRRALRKDGFDRIKFVDRTPPNFVVEACRNGNRTRLTIDRRGKARQPERIGRCEREIKSSDIPELLERAGYNRIDVVDGTPPRYRAEACNRSNQRIRIAISPWGELAREHKIGECTPPATVASLVEQLRGSKNITVVGVREGGRGNFVADVCSENGDRFDVRFSQWGEFIDTKRTGKCESPRIEEVLSRYEKGGFTNAQTFIVGCTRDGERLRLTIDQFGNETDRDRVGRCR